MGFRAPITCLLLATMTAATARAAEGISFSRQIAPILISQCQTCHGAEKAKGNYRVDSFERLMTTGESKKLPIMAENAKKSWLYLLLVAMDDADRMPQKADPLPAAQIALVKQWIEEGAKFDGLDRNASLASIAPSEQHPAPPTIYRQAVPITALALNPDGKTLAAAGYHEVTLWDPASGALRGRIQKVAQRTYSIAYSPDGRWLAVAGGKPGAGGEMRLIEVAKGDAGRLLAKTADVFLVARFSPDGRLLAAGGSDNAVHLVDVASGKQLLVIEQHADWITDLAFSPDGLMLATTSRDKSARVFEVKTGAMRSAFLTHEEQVAAIAWDADGKTIYTAGRDKRIRSWLAADGKQIGTVATREAEPLKLITTGKPGGPIYLASADGVARQYAPPAPPPPPADKKDKTAKPEPPVRPKETPPRVFGATGDCAFSLALDEKNKKLMVGGQDGAVQVIDLERGESVLKFVAAPGMEKTSKVAR